MHPLFFLFFFANIPLTIFKQTPWGYSATPPPNYNSFLKPLVQGAANALAAVNGVRFTTGDIYNTIYPASGNSADYAYSINVKAPLAVGTFSTFLLLSLLCLQWYPCW